MSLFKFALIPAVGLALSCIASTASAIDTAAPIEGVSFKQGATAEPGKSHLQQGSFRSMRDILPNLLLGETPRVGLALLQEGLVTIRWEAVAGNEVMILLALHDGELVIPEAVATPLINPGHAVEPGAPMIKLQVNERFQVLTF